MNRKRLGRMELYACDRPVRDYTYNKLVNKATIFNTEFENAVLKLLTS